MVCVSGFSWWFAIIFLWLYPDAFKVNAAGVGVHLYLASQLSDNDLDQSHDQGHDQLDWSYVFGGAFYPDSLYNCLGHSSLGEYNHWSPFLYQLAKLYKDKEKKDPMLRDFIYGVFTHQLADITWHSIHFDNGLLKFINNVEFGSNPDYSESHLYIDTIGDFIVLERILQNLSNERFDKVITSLKDQKWQIPYKELVSIYHGLGFKGINEGQLKYCMARGYSAFQAELSLVVQDGIDTDLSPLFKDVIDTYYLGGLQEIGNSIRTCMKNLQYWIDHLDELKDPRDICDLFSGTSSSSGATKGSITTNNPMNEDNDVVYLSTNIPHSYFGHDLVMGNFLPGQGVTVAISAPFEDNHGSVYLIPLDEFAEANIATITRRLSPQQLDTVSGNTRIMEYPVRFGHKMISYMDQFLLVASPGNCKISAYFENRLILELKYSHCSNVIGTGKGIRQLGSSIFQIDASNGVDIVIGSKHADDGVAPQRGIVFILDGDKLVYELLKGIDSNSIVALEMTTFIKHEFQLPLILGQDTCYENFGSQYTSIRVGNGPEYKAISVENLGIVVVYKDGQVKWVLTHDLQILKYNDSGLDEEIKKLSSKETGQFGASYIEFFQLNGKDEDKDKDKVYLLMMAKSKDKRKGVGYVYEMTTDSTDTTNIKYITSFQAPSYKRQDVVGYENFGIKCVLVKETNALFITGTAIYKSKDMDKSNYKDKRNVIFELQLDELINTIRETEAIIVLTEPTDVGFTNFGNSGLCINQHNNNIVVGMSMYGYARDLIGTVGIYKKVL